MIYTKFPRIILAFVLIAVCASSAEWLNTVEMQLNQFKMLAQLPQSVISQINGMKELMTENFSKVRGILQDVESITHFTDDIESILKSRHSKWQEGLTVDDLKERNEKCDKQLKQTFEAYLKALNATAKKFKNDENTRDKLL